MGIILELVRDCLTLLRVWRNQKQILKAVANGKSTVHLEIRPLGRGTIEHYYHFVFDLLLPLSRIVDKISDQRSFTISYFGPLSSQLKEIIPNQVSIINETPNQYLTLLGMNPNCMNRCKFDFDSLINRVNRTFRYNEGAKRDMIILIERKVPNQYYLKEAINKRGGSVRRSIKNHDDLKFMLQLELHGDYQFKNLVLEDMSIADQINCFRSCVLVIAQHGAGLANIIWMKKGSFVIEIGFRDRANFKKISRMSSLNYYLYRDYYQRHVKLNITNFRKWLGAHKDLGFLFKFQQNE